MDLQRSTQSENPAAMGKVPHNRRRVGWLVVGGLVVAATWWILEANAPWYKGRSVSHWFRVYASRDRSDREEAMFAFQMMGRSAVPLLVAELESRPSRFASEMNSLLNRIRSVKWDYDQQYNWRRERACDLLREMGESARDAIPSLEKASHDGLWYIATSARAALIKLRNEPIAPYLPLLNDRSDGSRWLSNALMIAACGTNAAPAIPFLVDSLRDPNGIIQAHALVALGMIRCEPQVCVPAIIPFLTNNSVSARQKAYGALLAFKAHAQGAGNEIILGLTDSDPWTRTQALLAVYEILSPAEKRRALPHAEALLNDPNRFVRQYAEKLLPKIRASLSSDH